jgi:hypothetical protein
MAIPAFDSNGLLPVGRHVATPQEVRASLVAAFPTSTSRPGLVDWWEQHRLALLELVPVSEQWIGGSFVTNKVDPGDVDVVSIFDAGAYNALASHRQRLVDSLLWDGHTRGFWHCDSYSIPFYPPGSPGHAVYQARWTHWDDFWGHTGANDPRGRVPKGFVVVR